MPRLLYVPMYSSPNRLATDSTFNWAKLFFRTVVEKDPEAFVYFPVPEGPIPNVAEIDHPRIFKIPLKMHGNTSQYQESARLQEFYVENFSDAGGPWHADMIVCDKAMVLPLLKPGLDMYFTNMAAPKVWMSKTHFIFDNAKFAKLGPEYEMAQSLGYSLADFVLWMSESDFVRGYGIAEKFLAPALLTRIQENKVLGGWFANFPSIEALAKDPMEKPRDRITLNYAMAANTDYHVEEILGIYDTIFRMRPNVRVLLTCPGGIGGTGGKILSQMSYAEVNKGLPQVKFFEKIRDAHVFIYWTHMTGPPTPTVMEQQMLGLVGVFSSVNKNVCLYPGYPYVGKSQAEMLSLATYLVDHYFEPDVQEVIRKQKEWNRSMFDPKKDAWTTYQNMKSLYDFRMAQLSKGRGQLIDLLKQITVGLPELNMDQLTLLVRKESRIGLNLHDPGSGQQVGTSLGHCRALMTQAGFKDICDGPDVRLVRM